MIDFISATISGCKDTINYSHLVLESENINTWKNGVERALKKYVQDGTEAKGQKCPNCGHESLVYQEGCLICKECGASRCG